MLSHKWEWVFVILSSLSDWHKYSERTSSNHYLMNSRNFVRIVWMEKWPSTSHNNTFHFSFQQLSLPMAVCNGKMMNSLLLEIIDSPPPHHTSASPYENAGIKFPTAARLCRFYCAWTHMNVNSEYSEPAHYFKISWRVMDARGRPYVRVCVVCVGGCVCMWSILVSFFVCPRSNAIYNWMS